ncbi:hypothetical protein HPP92_020207 [Vanilla planifolia]|uniref:Uncharacterized protein n=1 Tax=Vanilla planifolia TaxID=51239 RepID=A0A835ULN6_VANPL|nr:hypothetical protein HPP92_020564 [Vanilla planifolia]KAG0466043.1 hypothetical protein HPP92_020207 [Vanilla planifolia]
MLGIKSRSTTAESPNSEVGEIDRSAPFESVKAAVSLFGEVAFSGDKSSSRRSKSFSNEKALATETKLQLVQKEINKFKEQLHNAEAKRVQALAELEKAKAEVDDLTIEISSINESKEQALQVAEDAKSQINQLEESRHDGRTEKIMP